MDELTAVMLGHAVGDALGVPVEFKQRAALDADPVTGMRGGGAHDMPAGCWSDDTSMALATLDVLSRGKVDLDAIMRNFYKWFYEGEFTATGDAFDIGNTCMDSIYDYAFEHIGVDVCGRRDERSNGNGSLMRIHPVVVYLRHKPELSLPQKLDVIRSVSALTHAHRRAKIGCGIFYFVLNALLDEPKKSSVNAGLAQAKKFYEREQELTPYARLFEDGFADTPRHRIKSTGYVVDTLESAIWCILTADGYREAVLKAVNLGADTDTVGAVTGALAAALYGGDSIPEEWLGALLAKDMITSLCDRFNAHFKS